jgi:hypothetical protein
LGVAWKYKKKSHGEQFKQVFIQGSKNKRRYNLEG